MTGPRCRASALIHWLAIVAVVAGCAQPDAGQSQDEDASVAEAASAALVDDGASASVPTDTSFTLRANDLDAYRTGTLAEIARIEAASTELASAQTSRDTATVLLSIRPDRSVAEGAERAGIDVGRYRRIQSAISDVLGARVMGQMMMAQLWGVDTAGLAAAERAQLRESLREARTMEDDAYRKVPPDVQPLLRSRAGELDSLRLRLAGLRMRFGR